MSKHDELVLLDQHRPRLRFWHIALGGAAGCFLVLLDVGLWHWSRVRQQAELVAQIKQAGGYVDYYHDNRRLPDGDYEYGRGQSIFPSDFRDEYPDFCSQVFGANGLHISATDPS